MSRLAIYSRGYSYKVELWAFIRVRVFYFECPPNCDIQPRLPIQWVHRVDHNIQTMMDVATRTCVSRHLYGMKSQRRHETKCNTHADV